jgi:hypothetical protein
MAIQLEEMARMGGGIGDTAALTQEARRSVEGPVLGTLMRLAAPTVALMLLRAIIAAGEAACVGRPGARALAGASLAFSLVILMTALSAGAYGGGVASGFARARAFGWGGDSLFSLMACGLVLYGMVMVAVMRRELGFYAGAR